MLTFDMLYLIKQFKALFPEIAERDILYRMTTSEPNTLTIDDHVLDLNNRKRPTLIFVYNDRDDYKLVSKKCYTKENKAITELRSELSTTQTILKNERRRKTT